MSEYSAKTYRLKDNREITVRSARADDALALMEMVAGIFKSSSYLLTEPDEFNVTIEQERSWIESFISPPNNVLLLADFRGRPIGILDFQAGHRRRISHSGVIGTSVREEFRGQGVGSALISALMDWAKQHGKVERLELLVFADNAPAIGLYKKMGFIEEGRKKKALKLSDGRYFDELLMAKIL